jgi:hypothetical protein
MVSVLPLIEPGPETTLKVTLRPEVEEAESVMGDTPYVTGDEGAVKVIVCVA